MSSATEFVDYALAIGALELIPEGRELKSGRISYHFFNSGKFCTGVRMKRLAMAYAQVITGQTMLPNVIFGPSYKGSAIVVATAVCMDRDIGFAYNRKEAKTHGERGIIIGASVEGKKVTLVDDVMTTGSSLGEAADIVIANGGTPINGVIAFDRQECGTNRDLSAVHEFQKDYQIPVLAVAALDDLITVLRFLTGEKAASMLSKVLEYQKQYGVC